MALKQVSKGQSPLAAGGPPYTNKDAKHHASRPFVMQF